MCRIGTGQRLAAEDTLGRSAPSQVPLSGLRRPRGDAHAARLDRLFIVGDWPEAARADENRARKRTAAETGIVMAHPIAVRMAPDYHNPADDVPSQVDPVILDHGIGQELVGGLLEQRLGLARGRRPRFRCRTPCPGARRRRRRPRAQRSAPSIALPCGSRMPDFRVTVTRAFIGFIQSSWLRAFPGHPRLFVANLKTSMPGTRPGFR